MFEVYLESAAERDLKKLSPDLFPEIITAVKELALNPTPSGCRKISGAKNAWRIPRGDHRIIYEIDRKTKSVWVLRIKFRKDIYKRLKDLF